MIQHIQDQTTCDIFAGLPSKAARKIPTMLHTKAKQLLEVLNSAQEIRDMASPPGNQLHKLKDDLAGYWTIRINDQYRIVFKFEGGHAYCVRITDYH